MTTTSRKPGPGKKVGWLLLIWSASVASLAVVSLLIKLLMKLAGFHS